MARPQCRGRAIVVLPGGQPFRCRGVAGRPGGERAPALCPAAQSRHVADQFRQGHGRGRPNRTALRHPPPVRVSSRSAETSVSVEITDDSQNSSNTTGWSSVTGSPSRQRHRFASSTKDSGTGPSSAVSAPSAQASGRIRRQLDHQRTRMEPVRLDSTAASRSAPARSSLLTNAIRGTPCRSVWRHTDSRCGSTPATPSNTAIAPSRTRSDRSSHEQLTAAAKMVVPRSRSWESKSVTVVPSWTSPRL